MQYLSPFATYIRSLGKYSDWVGGKLDDITTIVARVVYMPAAERAQRQDAVRNAINVPLNSIISISFLSVCLCVSVCLCLSVLRLISIHQLLKAMSDMLAAEQAGSIECDVCGFKFKSPELRQAKNIFFLRKKKP